MQALQVAIGSIPILIVVITCALRMERRFAKLENEIEKNRNETRRNRKLTSALVQNLFTDQKARLIFSAAMDEDATEA